MDKAEIAGAVKTAISQALSLDLDEVAEEKSLLGDLGAESIDLLDMLFRVERSLKIKVQVSDIAAHIQGGIPDEEFADERNLITARGLAQLKKALPQIEPAALEGRLQAENLLSLFTVQNLIDLVYDRALSRA